LEAGTDVKRAIKNHAPDFAAILVLLLLSVVVAGYILNHERLRFPFIQSSPFTMNAEFSTAQAVTPGQGQTVRVSGVQIGDIGSVTLKNGIAIVHMDIDQKVQPPDPHRRDRAAAPAHRAQGHVHRVEPWLAERPAR
jgi:ABC-type transporter Mla subunit MlaD